jgi:hypothetical protein
LNKKLLVFEGEELYKAITMNIIQSGDKYEKKVNDITTAPTLRIESGFDENGFSYSK